METTKRTTKSPLALARTALAVARESLPLYSSKFSRHDYTQHQLYALLALRESFHADYRGLEAILRDWAELRGELGLTKVPDHTTIQKASQRLSRTISLHPEALGLVPPGTSAANRRRQPRAADDPVDYPLFPETVAATVETPVPIALADDEEEPGGLQEAPVIGGFAFCACSYPSETC